MAFGLNLGGVRAVRAALCAGLALCAPAGPALADAAPSDADIAALTAALEKRGCVIENYNDYGILTDSGLDADRANAVIAKLVADGTVFYDDKGMNLKTPKCLAEAAAAPKLDRAAFVAVMKAHGCTLKFAEAESVLAAAGFTPQTLNPIFDALKSEGLAEMGADSFTIKPEACK